MRQGNKVILTKDAKENYADCDWVNDTLTIETVSRKYMPAKEFYARNMPSGYHPGYDSEAKGRPLYDFVEDIGCSLYWWEVTRAP